MGKWTEYHSPSERVTIQNHHILMYLHRLEHNRDFSQLHKKLAMLSKMASVGKIKQKI